MLLAIFQVPVPVAAIWRQVNFHSNFLKEWLTRESENALKLIEKWRKLQFGGVV